MSFQVDHIDDHLRHVWSVLIIGTARRVTDPDPGSGWPNCPVPSHAPAGTGRSGCVSSRTRSPAAASAPLSPAEGWSRTAAKSAAAEAEDLVARMQIRHLGAPNPGRSISSRVRTVGDPE